MVLENVLNENTILIMVVNDQAVMVSGLEVVS